jgi:hypothetical protein
MTLALSLSPPRLPGERDISLMVRWRRRFMEDCQCEVIMLVCSR